MLVKIFIDLTKYLFLSVERLKPVLFTFKIHLNVYIALIYTLLAVILLIPITGCSRSPHRQTLILATTTSTYDSGILDYLLPDFEKQNNAVVRVISVGTGQAIALGEKGDCDLILVHDRQKEDRFVSEGYGVNRRDVMYNDFVMVGPESDPASILGVKEARQAFSKIAENKAIFISRGDDSGTYSVEKKIWDLADISPGGNHWYLSAGQGMGETLTIASEKQAYTLTDRGTFLALRGGLSLVVLCEGGSELRNPYGIIAVNPQKFSHVKYDLAIILINYLTSYKVQQRIAEFGKDKYGQPLFFPDSDEWRVNKGSG